MTRMKSKDLQAMCIVIAPNGKASILSKGAPVIEDKNAGLDILNRRIFISGEVRSSKNSRQLKMVTRTIKATGQKKIVPISENSKAAKKYKEDTCWYYKLFASSFRKMLENKQKPYVIEFQFVRQFHSKWDFANMIQIVQDMMVEYGWLDDDNVSEILPVPNIENPYLIDPKRPGIWIKVI
jgi:hypothetical protein